MTIFVAQYYFNLIGNILINFCKKISMIFVPKNIDKFIDVIENFKQFIHLLEYH